MEGIKLPSSLIETSDCDSMDQGPTALRKRKMNTSPPVVPSTGAIPKKSRTQAQSENPQLPASNHLLQNNKFAILPVENGDNEPVPRKQRIPPLFTPIKDLVQLQSKLAELSLEPLFKKCSKGTKIICSSLEEYQKVGKLLTTQRVPHYTHDNPSTKPLKIVLRGLPAYDKEKVESELKNLGLKPEAVYPMSRRSQAAKDDPFRDELFLIHFSKGSTTIGALRNIKQLFRVIIQWEPYRPQHRDVTQCTNCLWFGHGTRNCRMPPRCDQCAGEHLSATCVHIDDDDMEPKCANCEQNHRATSRTCPKRAEFIRIRKEASAANQPGRHRKPAVFTPDQFPPLQPRMIPVLNPLPLPNNNQQSRNRSVQPRLTCTKSFETQTSIITPGLSYAGATAGSFAGASASITNDDVPLSTEELIEIITAAIEIKRKYKTRSQQLAAIVSLINRNGP